MMRVRVKFSQGFTLIEMMIAMVISLFLLGGVVQIFISTKQSYRTAEDASRLQENGRFAMDIMTRDIRMAGFLPCRIQDGKIANSIDSTDKIYDFFGASISADEGGVSAFAGYPANRIAGADAIRISRGGSESSCVASHVPASATIHLCGPSEEFEKGDILLVCDAEKAALFQLSGPASSPPHTTLVHNTGVAGISPGNCTKNLGAPDGSGLCATNSLVQFAKDAQVVKFSSISYFIGTSTSGTTTSLYRIVNTDISPTPVELIEDIETMQILYGEDTTSDGIADQYVTGNNIVDSNNVVAVRIGLLVKSPNEVANVADTKTYNVAGTSISNTGPGVTHGGDRRLRAVYTTVIKIRNRGIL